MKKMMVTKKTYESNNNKLILPHCTLWGKKLKATDQLNLNPNLTLIHLKRLNS